MSKFNINIDVQQLADALEQSATVIEDKVIQAVEALSVSTHAFIVAKANAELSGFKRQAFLGIGDKANKTNAKSTSDPRVDQAAKNVRWVRVANGIWVVEIDESAAWIEEGRDPKFMGSEDWLLKPGAKGVKRARDGSLYRSIPFKQTEGGRPDPGTKPMYPTLIKQAMAKQGIHQTRIEKHPDGTPKLGVIHKLDVRQPWGGAEKNPGLYSRPRSAQEAALSGLKPHGGIFHLQDAVVIQREKPPGKRGGKGKIVKETVVFRTISSKHQAEGRWMYPAVKPFGAIPAAHEWAKQQWQLVLRNLEEELKRAGGG